MVHDYRALEVARNDAQLLINQEDFWTNDEYTQLRNYIEKSGVLAGEKLD